MKFNYENYKMLHFVTEFVIFLMQKDCNLGIFITKLQMLFRKNILKFFGKD